MTLDFLQDFKESCSREGVHYLVVYTHDKGENFRFDHNMNLLPEFVDYPDGCRRTRSEDMVDLIQNIPFKEECA